MKLSRKNWNSYVTRLSAINKTAGKKMQAWIDKHGTNNVEALVEYAYALTTSYGEAASAAACQMYDEIAAIQKAHVPPAEPKPTQHINYVDKAIRSTLDRAPSTVPGTVSEMVKRTGAETTLKNAQRDGAYFAWVPNGDTCAFCLTLASNGWRRASRKTVNGDHADHIHQNCNCEFAISFNGPGQIEGYDPDKYLAMYEGAEGSSWKDKVNAMRREQYAANKDAINAQKRAAYARRKTRETVANSDNGGIINITRISSPIESRKHPTGTPEGVAIAGDPLNARQKRLLERLVSYDDRIEVDKRDVSMRDLAAMTAHENVEFAMFTRRGKRLLIRGERNSVNITEKEARELARQGYRWSGHTHPGAEYYITSPSPGDRNVLSIMSQVLGQKYSVVYSSTGRKYVFAVEKADDLGRKE